MRFALPPAVCVKAVEEAAHPGPGWVWVVWGLSEVKDYIKMRKRTKLISPQCAWQVTFS